MDRMMTSRDPQADVARLWARYQHTEFPEHLRGTEIAGVDLSTLDTDIAGCVSTWSSTPGGLDHERLEVLTWCLADVNRVLPLLSEAPEAEYFRRLRDLAQLVVDSAS